MAEYVMDYDGWAEGMPIGAYFKVRDAIHERKRERIVRCRDCIHSYEHHDARGRWLLCNLQLYYEVKPEDFCSRGETEEDDSDESGLDEARR